MEKPIDFSQFTPPFLVNIFDIQIGCENMTAKEDFDAAVRGTNEWIDNLKLQLGWQDRERVYAVLLATLHALRDCLPRDEAIYLAAELPALLRGFYYAGWASRRP